MADVQPQDKDSGLVWREVVRQRTPRGLGRGVLTEKTMEGEQVEAKFFDKCGHVQHVIGEVLRNASGELVVESWAEGIRKETFVTRDANVDVLNRKPSR
jgi:hypothetical protein